MRLFFSLFLLSGDLANRIKQQYGRPFAEAVRLLLLHPSPSSYICAGYRGLDAADLLGVASQSLKKNKSSKPPPVDWSPDAIYGLWGAR